MYPRSLGSFACAAVLLLSACGRFGYDLLTPNGGDPGPTPQAGAGAGAPAGSGGGGGRSGRGGQGGRGGMDAAVPNDRDGGTAGRGGAAAPADAAIDDDASVPDEDAGEPDPPEPVCGQVSDYCAQLPALPMEPTIDGELECDLALQPITPVGWSNTTSPLPAGQGVKLAAAWRPDGVYFYVEVTDPTRLPRRAGEDVWCGDAVELYLDDDGVFAGAPMYDAPGTIQVLGAAPGDDTDAVRSGGDRWRAPNAGLRVGDWTSPRYGAFPKPFGYVFEAFMKADDLDLPSWTLAAGGAVGLDLSVSVSTSADPPPSGETPGCGLRLGQYFMRLAPPPCTTACTPFETTAAFCAPSLQP